jgi:hypothetical protein
MQLYLQQNMCNITIKMHYMFLPYLAILRQVFRCSKWFTLVIVYKLKCSSAIPYSLNTREE